MELETDRTGNLIYLRPFIKSLDANESNEFKNILVDIVNKGNNFIILNLSKVDFMDSSGLEVLISLLKMISLKGGKLALCEINKPVLNLLNLSRLDQIFNIFATEDEAVKFIKQR